MGLTAGKRGRRPARHIPELHLDLYRGPRDLPPLAETYDPTAAITEWGMLGNDQYSDCGPAAYEHGRMVKRGGPPAELVPYGPGGTPVPATSPEATALTLGPYWAYGKAQGEPGDQPDNGVDNESYFKWLYDNGFVEAYASVDLSNPDQVKQDIIDYKAILVGACLADDAEARFEADPQQPWDISGADPIDPNAGHDFLVVGWDTTGWILITWGGRQHATISFEQAELAAHDIDAHVFLTAEDAARANVDLAALRAAIEAHGGYGGQVAAPDGPEALEATRPEAASALPSPQAIEAAVQELETIFADAHAAVDAMHATLDTAKAEAQRILRSAAVEHAKSTVEGVFDRIRHLL